MCSDGPATQLKIVPGVTGLKVQALDLQYQHHLGSAGNTNTWASPRTERIRNSGAEARLAVLRPTLAVALIPVQVGDPLTCGWRPRLPSTPLSKGEKGRSPNERALQSRPGTAVSGPLRILFLLMIRMELQMAH